jgi:hypothetical protein
VHLGIRLYVVRLLPGLVAIVVLGDFVALAQQALVADNPMFVDDLVWLKHGIPSDIVLVRLLLER